MQRFIDTARGVLLDPTRTFANMRREGGIGAPLVYGVIGSVIGGLGAALWQTLFGGFSIGPPGFDGAAAGFSTFIVLPLVTIVGLFVASGIYHVMLMLLGAARFPFETTFRVVAYGHGSTYPIAIIPVCGGFIATVWAIVAVVIGLAQAQETTTGKALIAVLVPVAVCCVLMFIFWAAVAAIVFGAAAMSH